MSTPSGAIVRMLAPNGQSGDIPQERMQDALASGFKLAVPMLSPDGTTGYIPHDRVLEAQKSGFKTTASLEQQPESSDYGFNASNLLKSAGGGVAKLAGGLYGMGKDVLFPEGKTEGQRLSFLAKKYVFDPADRENALAQRGEQSGVESVGHSAAAALPFVGPWAAGLGERAGSGDVGGALAEGGSQVLAMKAASQIPRIPLSRNAAAEQLRFPATARQSQLGRPGTVKNILPPFLQKYTIPEGLIPKGDLGTPTNPGPFMEIPARMPKAQAPETPTPPLGSPENPGWYAKLPTRMPKQLPAPKPQLPFLPSATPSNVPVGNESLPSGIPQGSPMPFPAVMPKAQATGSAAQPFEPLIFESPEEAAAHDVRMQNLQRQAKAAGTYHAAQGASAKKTNLQQRIQKKIGSEE